MDQMSFKRNAKFWGIRFTKEFLDAHNRQNKILAKICKIIRKMLIAGEIADIYDKGRGIYVVLSDGSDLTKAKFRDLLTEKYNVFESQGKSASQTESVKRGLVTYALERFLGYGTRNDQKKIPRIRIHGKSFYMKDTSAKVDIDNKTLTVPTLYGKCTMDYKYSLKEDLFLERQNSKNNKCTGGNIVIRQGCYVAAVEVSKPLLYKPVGVLGTDFNRSPQDWVCLSDDEKISLPDDIETSIDKIRELNTYLDTDKKKQTHERQYKSKARRPKRLAWKEEHKKVKNAIRHVVLKIVEKAISNKLLIAIDSVQTGAKSGTFGQEHLIELFQVECENRGVPFYVVPCKDTSRRCSKCGNIDKDNRASVSEFVCTECFTMLDAQLNGAVNVAYAAERMYFGIHRTEDTFISNLFDKLDKRQCIIPYGNYKKRNVDNLINSYKEKQVELPLTDV